MKHTWTAYGSIGLIIVYDEIRHVGILIFVNLLVASKIAILVSPANKFIEQFIFVVVFPCGFYEYVLFAFFKNERH